MGEGITPEDTASRTLFIMSKEGYFVNGSCGSIVKEGSSTSMAHEEVFMKHKSETCYCHPQLSKFKCYLIA